MVKIIKISKKIFLNFPAIAGYDAQKWLTGLCLFLGFLIYEEKNKKIL